MLNIILIAIVISILVLLLLAAKQPADFKYSRSETMNASDKNIFEHLNDLHKVNAWSPWVKLDPNLVQTYSGEPYGVGAVYEWEGNSRVGKGRMTIVQSKPNTLVRTKLEFIKPIAATNVGEFKVEWDGKKSTVYWSMEGKNAFIGKIMGLFMNMEKMIGDQFSQGLSDLTKIVEKKPKK